MTGDTRERTTKKPLQARTDELEIESIIFVWRTDGAGALDHLADWTGQVGLR